MIVNYTKKLVLANPTRPSTFLGLFRTQELTKQEIEDDMKKIEELEDKMLEENCDCRECGEFLYGEKDCKVCKQMKFIYGV